MKFITINNTFGYSRATIVIVNVLLEKNTINSYIQTHVDLIHHHNQCLQDELDEEQATEYTQTNCTSYIWDIEYWTCTKV